MAEVKAKVPRKKASKRQKKDWFAGYVLIAPVTIGLLVFYIWSFIQNFWVIGHACKRTAECMGYARAMWVSGDFSGYPVHSQKTCGLVKLVFYL